MLPGEAAPQRFALEKLHLRAASLSLEGTGTNALLRTPPDLFPSRFGPNSLALHRADGAATSFRTRGCLQCLAIAHECGYTIARDRDQSWINLSRMQPTA